MMSRKFPWSMSGERMQESDYRETFYRLLIDGMRDQEISSAQLALKLGVSPRTVEGWRQRGSTAMPKIHLIPLIAKILRIGDDGSGHWDPGAIWVKLGLMPADPPSEAHALALRIEKLKARHQSALERSQQWGRANGCLDIVAATMASGRWAVALWPVVEGPAGCRMHVADRLDFTSTTGAGATRRQVFADPALFAALRAAFAVPATRTPRWETDPEVIRAGGWSVDRVGSPRAPLRTQEHPEIRSMGVVATTVHAWGNDLAGLLARAIGYGASTTRDLAIEVNGLDSLIPEPRFRAEQHAYLLASPPARRVWSHALLQPLKGTDPFAVERGDVPMVWLRESDEVLRRASRSKLLSLDFKALATIRDEATATASRHSHVDVIEVDPPEQIADRWSAVLRHTAAVFEDLERNKRLASDARQHWDLAKRLDPDVAATFLPWLEKYLASAPRVREQMLRP